jgi:hypothetical protein
LKEYFIYCYYVNHLDHGKVIEMFLNLAVIAVLHGHGPWLHARPFRFYILSSLSGTQQSSQPTRANLHIFGLENEHDGKCCPLKSRQRSVAFIYSLGFFYGYSPMGFVPRM